MKPELVSLNTVFRIEHGNGFDLNKMSECAGGENAVVFIGRTAERNGCVAVVERTEIEPFGGGLITVALGGSALSSFVQPQPFYTAQNIDVLYPLAPMSFDTKLYYALCIEANRFRYSTFGREANRTLKYLLIPALRRVPSWVEGITEAAVSSLCVDINNLAPEKRRR